MAERPQPPVEEELLSARPDRLDVEAIRLRARLRSKMFGVESTPQTIGRYRVLETLGAGGMGVVYGAHDPELDRKVAIKVLHEIPDERSDYWGRLTAEARALARLSHPNVVQVFEIGRHQDRMFLAMEFIAGPTMKRWQTSQERDPNEIVDKYVQAGRGLAAAHHEGIVHRDLKPANLLIGADDRVRVVDFGLARAAGSDKASDVPRPPAAGAEQSLTHTGDLMGTPAYMAPEQIDRRTTDALSDQFSFCVALYEALHRERPHAGSSAAEIMLSISEGRRRDTPRIRGLPRRVSAAIERGLRVDPAQRFPSMNELLDALAPTNRGFTRMALGVLAVGIAGSAFLVPNAEVASPCADVGAELDGIWDDARRDELRGAFESADLPSATKVRDLVVGGLDAYAKGWVTRRAQHCTTAAQGMDAALLDTRYACLEGRRRSLEALVDSLTKADADAVENAPVAVSSLPGLEVCDNDELLRHSVHPPSRAVAIRVGEIRAALGVADSSAALGRYQGALEAATEAVTRARAVDYPPVLAEALLSAGRAQSQVLALAEAERNLMAAADLAEAHRHDEVAADAWISLVEVYGRSASRLEDTLQAARRADAAITRLADDPSRRADLWDKLGYAHIQAEDPTEASAAYHRSLELRASSSSETLALAWTETLYADTLAASGKVDEALPRFEHALAVIEEQLGERHPTYAKAIKVRGFAMLSSERFDEALRDFESALAVYERVYGRSAPRVADVLEAIAELEVQRDELGEGLEAAERALAIRRADPVGASSSRLTSLILVAELRHARKDAAGAIPLYREAAAALTPDSPEYELRRAGLFCNEGLALVEEERHDEALVALDRALAALGSDEEGPLWEFCSEARAKAAALTSRPSG